MEETERHEGGNTKDFRRKKILEGANKDRREDRVTRDMEEVRKRTERRRRQKRAPGVHRDKQAQGAETACVQHVSFSLLLQVDRQICACRMQLLHTARPP